MHRRTGHRVLTMETQPPVLGDRYRSSNDEKLQLNDALLMRRARFGIHALLAGAAIYAVIFAWHWRPEDLTVSLRHDLNLPATTKIELIDKRIEHSFADFQKAWFLVQQGSQYRLVAASRCTDLSRQGYGSWSRPGLAPGMVTPAPFDHAFGARPSESEIEQCMRYSDDWW
ncbi:hypothetical protein Enr13x_18940 [Stieleria neptunia]|uniref:Uncharacterized protein n=1 Tax=Stieleria neptunia TaxID=2527979 RepID=A0A518HMH0_9BACT|nr:hypothetical protein Enr13x_18940 [Stieleria neptunia]